MMWADLDVPVNVSEWAMAELVRHPEIQRKVQQEIDDVAGCDRAVRESDIPNLPYLKCVLKEVFRVHPGVRSTAYEHGAGQTSWLRHPGLHVCDDQQHRAGGEFQHLASRCGAVQTRTLGSERSAATPRPGAPHQNPFGLGRRSCPGMALGSTLVLLCLATLVQTFHWGPSHGQNREDIDMRAAIHGLMPMQTPLKVLATPRSRNWEIDS